MALTKNQQQVYNYIKTYAALNHQAVPLFEIKEAYPFMPVQSIRNALKALTANNYIRKNFSGLNAGKISYTLLK